MHPQIPVPAATPIADIALPPIDRAGESPAPAIGFTDRLRDNLRTGAHDTNAVGETANPTAANTAQSGDRVHLTGAFDRLNTAMHKLRDVEKQQETLYERIDTGELNAASPEVRRAERRITTELMNLQIAVQQANFGVELVSKVVEHGSSGMKTVLQTQA